MFLDLAEFVQKLATLHILDVFFRYSFYALALVLPKAAYYPITWLRYTTFIVLYPIGVTGELWCCVSAMPRIQKENLYSIGKLQTWDSQALSWLLASENPSPGIC